MLGIEKIVGLAWRDNLALIEVMERMCMKFERVVMISDNDSGTALYS